MWCRDHPSWCTLCQRTEEVKEVKLRNQGTPSMHLPLRRDLQLLLDLRALWRAMLLLLDLRALWRAMLLLLDLRALWRAMLPLLDLRALWRAMLPLLDLWALWWALLLLRGEIGPQIQGEETCQGSLRFLFTSHKWVRSFMGTPIAEAFGRLDQFSSVHDVQTAFPIKPDRMSMYMVWDRDQCCMEILVMYLRVRSKSLAHAQFACMADLLFPEVWPYRAGKGLEPGNNFVGLFKLWSNLGGVRISTQTPCLFNFQTPIYVSMPGAGRHAQIENFACNAPKPFKCSEKEHQSSCCGSATKGFGLGKRFSGLRFFRIGTRTVLCFWALSCSFALS